MKREREIYDIYLHYLEIVTIKGEQVLKIYRNLGAKFNYPVKETTYKRLSQDIADLGPDKVSVHFHTEQRNLKQDDLMSVAITEAHMKVFSDNLRRLLDDLEIALKEVQQQKT